MKEFIEGELETIFQNLKIIEKSIRNDIDEKEIVKSLTEKKK